jgi:RNA polymerase sigma-54 factor
MCLIIRFLKKSTVKLGTDDKLSAILNEKGYQIARRTVAKYREQLGLPVARLRKEL